MTSNFTGIVDATGGLPEFTVTKKSTALMIIDMQYMDAHRDFGIGERGRHNGLTQDMEYYFRRLDDTVVPNIRLILDSVRSCAIPVVHVRVMNLSGDSSDTSWRYKAFGLHVPPNSKDSEILEELAPRPDEIVLSKTTSSVFISTNIDFILRNMGIDTLIMTGVVTNNCVESSTRNACDLGYRVLLVEDACAAWTKEDHMNCLKHLHRNFALVRSTTDILGELTLEWIDGPT